MSIRMDGEPRPLPGGRGRHERSSILADRRQRRVLSELASVSQPVTVDDLCRRLAARDDDTDGSSLESIRIDLRHRCLPRLETVGWIERRPDGIRLGDPLFADSVPFSMPSLREPDDPVWDVVSALLARPYRRHILVAVAERDGYLTVEELAGELRGVVDDERTLPASLHHTDLPKLAALGTIEYDRDWRAAAPTDRLSTYLDRLGLDA